MMTPDLHARPIQELSPVAASIFAEAGQCPMGIVWLRFYLMIPFFLAL